MVLDCEQILNSLDQCRWNIVNVDNLVRDILDASHGYIMDHFASLIASDSFLSLGHGQNYTISRLEHLLLKTASALTPDQACRAYPRSVRLNQLLTAKIIKMPNPLSNENLKSLDRNYDSIQLRHEDDEMDWNEEFVRLVSALLSAVEQCLIRQCSRAMRVNAWQRLDVDLRMKIQKLACLSEPVEDRKLRSSTSSMNSLRNFPSQSSSQSSRTNDLRQVKLAIQAHTKKTQLYEQYYKSNNFQGPPPVAAESNIPVIKRTIEKSASAVIHPKPAARRSELNRITKSSTQSHVPEPIQTKLTHKRSQSDDLSSEIKPKLIPIKARYMEPRKPRTPLMEQKSSNRLQLKGKNISSSESSTRTSSPAFNRKRQSGVSKNPAKASNLSLDSLSSPAKQKNSLMSKNKADNMELSIDSLVDSMRSSFKTEKTISQESLGRKILDDSSKLGKVYVENKLKKMDLKAKLSLDSNKQKLEANKQQFNHNNQIRRSFLSQKSKEILARKSVVSSSDKDSSASKQSPTSNSSLTTKSTKSSSPRLNEINKSSSSSSIQQKKKVFSTTLHLRKTATLSEPASVAVAAIKIQKISKSISSNKVVGNSKVIKKDESVTTKKVIVNSKIAKSSAKIPMQVQPIIQIAPVAKEEIVEFESKLARSNTFCIDENTSELLGLH